MRTVITDSKTIKSVLWQQVLLRNMHLLLPQLLLHHLLFEHSALPVFLHAFGIEVLNCVHFAYAIKDIQHT